MVVIGGRHFLIMYLRRGDALGQKGDSVTD